MLVGEPFDEHGEPLYACGTSKAGRRYRYYVSRKLVRGPASEVNDGRRLAAPELERAVTAAITRIIKDKTLTGEALHGRISRRNRYRA
jgi:site-specific DNA recombinase